jgi:hypothetical protein
MTKYFLNVLSVLACSITPALSQNLVANSSFEVYLPDSINGGTGNGDVSKAEAWVSVGPGTTDYFNADYNFIAPRVPMNEYGSEVAHSGQAYAGIYTFQIVFSLGAIRDYLRTQLTSPLEAGESYTISFYYSLSDYSQFASSFGVRISDTIGEPMDDYLILAPATFTVPYSDDTADWVFFSQTYHAVGGEKYITIGNFENDLEIDTSEVGGPYEMAYYYIDDVTVEKHPFSGISESEKVEWNVFPNPTCDYLQIESDFINPVGIEIVDLTGRVVLSSTAQIESGYYTLDVSMLSSGNYIVKSGANTFKFTKF